MHGEREPILGILGHSVDNLQTLTIVSATDAICFGLIHVDYETLERTPKDSARWFAETVKQNGRPD